MSPAESAAVDVRALIHELLGRHQVQQNTRPPSLVANGEEHALASDRGPTTKLDAHGGVHDTMGDAIRSDGGSEAAGGEVTRRREDDADARLHVRPALPWLISHRKVGHAEHFEEMRRSLFCLCPSGDLQPLRPRPARDSGLFAYLRLNLLARCLSASRPLLLPTPNPLLLHLTSHPPS